MSMTWINADEPTEQIECPWYSQGVDIAGEKGVGKALTYGEKNFILKFFNIATDKDDPDAFQHRFEQQASKEIIAKIRAVWTQLGYKSNRIDEQTQAMYGENLNQLNEDFATEFLNKLVEKLNAPKGETA
ncbi:ERF superfamily protein [compost metagenome]